MISKLTGTLDSLQENSLILDVGGVGYGVLASSRTLRQLGRAGEGISLLIETHVREDAITLYGFASAEERNWFRLLTTVQGVGAKVALSILSCLSPDELTTAIAAADKTALSRADGVGPKLALRLTTELKDKVASLAGLAPAIPASLSKTSPLANESGARADTVSALVNLGYQRMEAFVAVSTVAATMAETTTASALIRAALLHLGKDKAA
jgi:holliday junction DNA helicase RuvA